MYPLSFTQVSEPGRVQPVMPPTLQTLTYSTGAAFLVGRSAACALATATIPAADPSIMLLMSVICDLQFNVVGVGSTFALLPIRLDVGSLPQQLVGPSCDRESSRSHSRTYAYSIGSQLRLGDKSP